MSRHILMCDPTHYRIAYEINPWMRRANAVLTAEAQAQWQGLHATLQGLGVQVDLVEPGPDVPDMTFVANAGIVLGKRFVPANFRYAERQPEAARFIRWFEERGYEIVRIHEPHFWEGEGDVLPCAGQVFAGFRFRTEHRALDHLDEILGTPTVRLELIDPRFYHLDTCFFPITDGLAAYYPPAFNREARDALRERFADLIEVPEHDALRFACNAFRVDGTVVVNTECDSFTAALRERGYRCVETPTAEFIKAGGSVKCLILMLDAFEGLPSAS